MKQPALLVARLVGSLIGACGAAMLWERMDRLAAAKKSGLTGHMSAALIVAYVATIAGSFLLCWASWRRLTPSIVNGLAFFAGLFLWMWLRGQRWMFESLAGLHDALPAIAAPLLALVLAWFMGSWLKHALFRKEPEIAPAAPKAAEE